MVIAQYVETDSTPRLLARRVGFHVWQGKRLEDMTDAEIVAAFEKQSGNAELELLTNPLSIDRLEWEHIQRVLAEHDGNISATARSLNMHRRTLQRKLGKNPSKN